MSAASMSRQTMGGFLGLYLKNRRKIKFTKYQEFFFFYIRNVFQCHNNYMCVDYYKT